MTREEAKQLLPIIQAYAEGKTIQVKLKTDSNALSEKWVVVENPDFDIYECYRIKPEPTYRPFNSAKECWQEMQKHQPFGWIKDKKTNAYELLKLVAPKDGVIDQYTCVFKRCVFADGTPFGIKEGTDD